MMSEVLSNNECYIYRELCFIYLLYNTFFDVMLSSL